ncbi:MAG: hypothetical protein HBSAPP03_00550 [Phycisphaerae bacterium]|nr:MAG: hypothetical protein HBSAPP03_00550 [Phycisphaerae bacterium]
MSTDPLAMLSAAGRIARSAARVPDRASAGSGDFAKVLAGEGAIPVRVAPGVDVSLGRDQLARLAVEADKAEARGVGRALVLLDGRVFSFDVATRTITGTVDPAAGGIEAGYDAVIAVPAGGAPETSPPGALLRKLGGAALRRGV